MSRIDVSLWNLSWIPSVRALPLCRTALRDARSVGFSERSCQDSQNLSSRVRTECSVGSLCTCSSMSRYLSRASQNPRTFSSATILPSRSMSLMRVMRAVSTPWPICPGCSRG